MADLRTFTDLVVATARRKSAAAQARQNPDPTAEKPRDAILAGLHLVGDTIADEGFVFSPSAMRFARKSGDFTFAIHIQSDRNNVAGHFASIRVHVGVTSRALAAWVKKHPSDWIRSKSAIAATVVGNQL